MTDRCDVLCLDLVVAEDLRRLRPSVDDVAAAAGGARALGDPTRLTIAAALRETDELCVCDLAWIVERAQNLVSHHVRVLRQEGIVRARRDGKMAMYSLTPDGRALLESVFSFVGAPS